jgi:hypothetical protein
MFDEEERPTAKLTCTLDQPEHLRRQLPMAQAMQSLCHERFAGLKPAADISIAVVKKYTVYFCHASGLDVKHNEKPSHKNTDDAAFEGRQPQ